MRKNNWKLFAMLLIALLAITALCQVKPNSAYAQAFDEKGYYDYYGTLNNKIDMTASLYSHEGNLTGGYVKENSSNICPLSGSLKSSKLELMEYDSRHKAIALLEGTLGADEIIIGTRTDLKSGATQSFKWSLQSTLPGVAYGHRYETAGFNHDAAVDQFAAGIQKALREGNKTALAKSVQYPITVNINGKRTKIGNQKAFIQQYNGIFHPVYKKTLLDTPARFMFSNYQGVMFGSGASNLWIAPSPDSAYKAAPVITSINN